MDGKTERYGIVLNKTKNVCVWVHITQMKTDDTGAKQIKQAHKNEPTNNNIYIYIYMCIQGNKLHKNSSYRVSVNNIKCETK